MKKRIIITLLGLSLLAVLLSGNGNKSSGSEEDSVRAYNQLYVDGEVEIRFQKIVCYGEKSPIIPDSTVYIVDGIRRVLKLEPLDTIIEYE